MSDVLDYASGQLTGGAWPAYAVIGDPVAHTLSPRLHRAALVARGVEPTYGAIRVASTDLLGFLATAGDHGMRGLNVTVPHKLQVLPGCARQSEEVEAIGAANTLVRRDGEWVAHNTDARGMALAVSRSLGRRLPRFLEHGVILGAGGAARAALVALQALGVRRISVLARRPERAAWAQARGAVVRAFDDDAPRTATILIQATPVGLHVDDPSPLEDARLPRQALVMDLVYGAHVTRLVERARAVGCTAEDGRPMLVAQAALSFSLWFGAEAPLVAMASAIGLDW